MIRAGRSASAGAATTAALYRRGRARKRAARRVTSPRRKRRLSGSMPTSFFSAHHHGRDAPAAHQRGSRKVGDRRAGELVHQLQAFPTAEMRAVVRPTRCIRGWLDMTRSRWSSRCRTGPTIAAHARHVDRRVRSPGWRTTGTRPALPRHVAGAAGLATSLEEFKLPANSSTSKAPTPYVWIIGRTKTAGPPDYDAVHKTQAGYSTPLSQGRRRCHRAGPGSPKNAAQGAGRRCRPTIFRLRRRALKRSRRTSSRADHRCTCGSVWSAARASTSAKPIRSSRRRWRAHPRRLKN